MKKHSFALQIIIFSIIFLSFILPPFFITSNNYNQNTFQIWNFPFEQFISFILVIIFFIFFINEKDSSKKNTPNFRKISFFNFFSTAVFGFSFLFFISLIFKIISIKNINLSNKIVVERPKDFLQIIFAILTFIFSASFEEIIYRAYFPDALLNIFNYEKIENKAKKNILRIFCEILGILVFTFAHFYAGILSTINAAFAHCILRILYIKHKNIIGNICAHSLYNILILFIF